MYLDLEFFDVCIGLSNRFFTLPKSLVIALLSVSVSPLTAVALVFKVELA
jgi:hypothetical protein